MTHNDQDVEWVADEDALGHLWDGLATMNDRKHPAWAALTHVKNRLASIDREALLKDERWMPIETFSEPTTLSSGCGVLVACSDGTVGEAYFRNFGDESDGWWWANTSWGDYPEPGRPTPSHWQPHPAPPSLPPVGEDHD